MSRMVLPCEFTVRAKLQSRRNSEAWRFEACVLQPCGNALLLVSGIDFWSSPTGHTAGLGLLDWFSMLTQQAEPCLVYKLMLYYFQVFYEREPRKSLLQDGWFFFLCSLFVGLCVCVGGGWRWGEGMGWDWAICFLLPILYLAISKYHHTEKMVANWQYDRFLYKPQSRLGVLFTVIITSKCNALLYFSSTSSYLLVMDFCKPNYILSLKNHFGCVATTPFFRKG